MTDQVERFQPQRFAMLNHRDDGDWVRYSDYEKLEKKWTATRDRLDAESEKAEQAEVERDQAQENADAQHRMVGEIHTELEQTRTERDEARKRAFEEVAAEFEAAALLHGMEAESARKGRATVHSAERGCQIAYEEAATHCRELVAKADPIDDAEGQGRR